MREARTSVALTDRRQYSALVCILLLGLAIRLWGVSFGLPAQLHPDEPQNFLTAQELHRTGTISRENRIGYSYPPLYIRLLLLQQVLLGRVSQFTGFECSQACLFLIGRVLNVVLSTGTIVVAFLLTRLVATPLAALSAALFSALNPTLIEHARYMTADVPVTLLTILTAFLSLRTLDTRKTAHVLLGLIAGLLGFATKYTAFVALTIPVYVIIKTSRDASQRVKRAVITGVLIAFAVWLMISRYHMLHMLTVPGNVTGELLRKRNPVSLISLGENLSVLLDAVGGWLPASTALLGVAAAWKTNCREKVGALLFAVFVFLLSMSLFPFSGVRHLLPVIACAAVLWAVGLDGLLSLTGSRDRARGTYRGVLAMALLASLTLGPWMVRDVAYARFISRKDTRLETVEWFRDHARPGARIAIERHAVEFRTWYGGYRGPEFYWVEIPSLSSIDIEWLARCGVDYLVTDSRVRNGSVSRSLDPRITRRFQVVRTISNNGRPGPDRTILKNMDPHRTAASPGHGPEASPPEECGLRSPASA